MKLSTKTREKAETHISVEISGEGAEALAEMMQGLFHRERRRRRRSGEESFSYEIRMAGNNLTVT